jgi:predicted RNase H-like HicB family nuclease
VVAVTDERLYEVKARRDGRFWSLEVPEINRVTQARSVEEAGEMARELIELMTGESDFSICIQFQLPLHAHNLIDAAVVQRELASRANAASAASMREAALALHDADVTVRDIGRILGMSHQRAHQLVQGASETEVKEAVRELENAIANLNEVEANASLPEQLHAPLVLSIEHGGAPAAPTKKRLRIEKVGGPKSSTSGNRTVSRSAASGRYVSKPAAARAAKSGGGHVAKPAARASGTSKSRKQA